MTIVILLLLLIIGAGARARPGAIARARPGVTELTKCGFWRTRSIILFSCTPYLLSHRK